MSEQTELKERVEKLEKYVRNMRLAVIVIVAFFVYDALTEAGILGQQSSLPMTTDTMRTHELLVIAPDNTGMLRIGAGANQQLELTLDNEDGERLYLEAGSLGLLQTDRNQQRVHRMLVDSEDIHFYGKNR